MPKRSDFWANFYGAASKTSQAVGSQVAVNTARQMLAEILSMPDKNKKRAIQDLRMQGEKQRQQSVSQEMQFEPQLQQAKLGAYTAARQASEAKTNALTNPSPGGKMVVTNEHIQAAARMAAEGSPPSLLGGNMGGYKYAVAGEYEKLRKDDPGLLTFRELETNYKAELRRASTLNSQQTQSELVAIDQFNGAIDSAVESMRSIKHGNFIPLNKLKQSMATRVYSGNKEYADELAKAQAMVQEIAIQSSRVFSGTAATDIRAKQELDRLNTTQSLHQFETVARTMKQIANLRKTGILELPTYLPPGVRPQTANPNAQPGEGATPQLRQGPSGEFDDLLKQHGLMP